jgi:ABC-type transport system substrate-binding protein
LLTVGSRSNAGQLLRGAVADGLVALDAQGQVVPALADRWIVEDDGLSYIFRLRTGNWPDGSPISAASVQAGLRQSIAALRGSAMALDLAGISEIRVMTGRVIELRLNRPQPDLLTLLAQPELSLLRKGRGAGPMRMSRDGAVATLTPIEPEKRGLAAMPDWAERARKLNLRQMPAERALQQFNQGKVSAVLGGTTADLPVVGSPGLPRGALRFDPVQGLFGLAVVNGDGFLSQASNREAISIALDRNVLMANFAVTGWTGTTRPIVMEAPVVPAPVLPADVLPTDWASQTLEQRRSTAAARVAKWRSGKSGAAALQLRIAMPAGAGADQLFSGIASDLKQVGIDARRVATNEAADLRMVDSVASYPRAAWYFNQLSCASRRWLCSSEADKLYAEASATTDVAERATLMAQAEAKLTEANVFIPFGPPVRWSLVRSGTTGFALNRLGYHPLMPLALLPK